MVSKKLFSALLIFCLFLNFSVGAQELQLKVDETMPRLLQQADTDGDKKITIEDHPKRPFLIPYSGGDSLAIEEIYYLSNLLQELAIARGEEKQTLQISLERIKEAPSQRISRRIKEQFWDDLTRTIDRKVCGRFCGIQKLQMECSGYMFRRQTHVGIKYYRELQQELSGFEVVILPQEITPQYVKSINNEPGLLALKIENGKGVPFVVPGGRFNEMYGWDSYFEGVGLAG